MEKLVKDYPEHNFSNVIRKPSSWLNDSDGNDKPYVSSSNKLRTSSNNNGKAGISQAKLDNLRGTGKNKGIHSSNKGKEAVKSKGKESTNQSIDPVQRKKDNSR